MDGKQIDIQPQARMIQLLEQFWLGKSVSAAARLRLADRIVEGHTTPAALAKATGTHEPSLRRLLRALCAYGFLHHNGDQTLGLTPVGETLISGRPGSMRAILETLYGADHYAAWGNFEHALKTGQTAFDAHFGMDVWAYYRKNPEAGATFNQAMVDSTAASDRAILDKCDFTPYLHIVDVGGGHGSVLRLALGQNPHATGTIFDQPQVVDEVRRTLTAPLKERITLAGGDFFESVPAGGDAYLLKYILHDWDDARCLTILRNIRKAIAPGGRLFVFDAVLKENNEPDFGALMDLNMLVMTGGRERTEPEFRDLLRQTGFELKRVTRTDAPVSIVEAIPV
jgi:hypothetical protein